MSKLIVKCLKDDAGTEMLEYALLVGLIVVGALGLMSALGNKIVHRWEDMAEQL